MLQDETKIGLHVALTPTWSETAWFADYMLPMGLGTERHDTMSQETHAGAVARLPPAGAARRAREARRDRSTRPTRPTRARCGRRASSGSSCRWRIDPDGSLGIRKYFESPYRPGEQITVDEYYGWIFENSVPGLPEAAAKESLTPLAVHAQVRRVRGRRTTSTSLRAAAADGALARPRRSSDEVVLKDGVAIGVVVDGVALAGFTTPSRRLEFYSPTLADWGWPEHAVPRYVPGHVHWRDLEARRRASSSCCRTSGCRR